MAETKEKSKKGGSGVHIISPKALACYAHVWEPRESLNPGGKPAYSIVLVFDKKTDLSKLKAAASTAARNFFGAKIPKNLISPFRDGNDKDDPIFKNKIFVQAKSRQKPGIVDHNVDPIIDESEFYSGCYCKASLYAFAFDKAGNKGVSFLLNNLQKMGDGEHLSGKRSAEEDFEAEDADDDEEGERPRKSKKTVKRRDEEEEDEDEEDEDEEDERPQRASKKRSNDPFQ